MEKNRDLDIIEGLEFQVKINEKKINRISYENQLYKEKCAELVRKHYETEIPRIVLTVIQDDIFTSVSQLDNRVKQFADLINDYLFRNKGEFIESKQHFTTTIEFLELKYKYKTKTYAIRIPATLSLINYKTYQNAKYELMDVDKNVYTHIIDTYYFDELKEKIKEREK